MSDRTDQPHDGWNPILSADGIHYCSPRCGGGTFCRKEWHDHAVAQADALAKTMGDGWEPVVWENLGWHHKVRRGIVEIYAQEDRHQSFPWPVTSYWADVRTSVQQFTATANDPQDALGFALQEARTLVARIAAELNDFAGIEG